MTFWILVAGLLAVALFILILPVLRQPQNQDAETTNRQRQNIAIAREKKALLEKQLEQAELSQSEYDESFRELETALAIDLERDEKSETQEPGKWMSWLVLALIPVISVSLYLKLGEYRVINNPALAEVRQVEPQQDMSIEAMLERVRQRLRDNPEDAQGWFILGRTLMSTQQFDQAVTAFQRTYDLVGEDPGVMFTLADALALQNKGSMSGEPEQLVKRALELAPQDPTGLWLAGLAAEQRQDYKAAHSYWASMLPLISDDVESSQEVQRLLAVLETRDPDIEAIATTSVLPSSAGISLSVDLDGRLRDQVAPGDAVFVYAKAMQGPPVPLAVKKLTVADLPISVNLSDSDAMMPTMKLSAFDQVIVGARVSKSGNPIAQAGDLFVEQDSIDSKNPPDNMLLIINSVK